MTCPDLDAEVAYRQKMAFVVRDQADDRGGAPVPDRIEVDSQVAVVAAERPVRILLAGTQGDADPAVVGP